MFKGRKLFIAFLDFIEILLISSAIFVILYVFIGQLIEIDGKSMYPYLHHGDKILSEKFTLKYRPLQRGETVVFFYPKNPQKLLIKRVVGLPNEKIKISGGSVYINGLKLVEQYIGNGVTTNEGQEIKENITYTIADKSYVLMGDNRMESSDSRDFGAVKLENIVGRPVFIFYPLNRLYFL